ncbi:MAG: ABC transporter ATP-binding protein [Treponema sp.]
MEENMQQKKIMHPEKVISYFKAEWLPLTLVTISGIVYNVGMVAGPYFEGQLAQCLFDIINKKKTFSSMLSLAIIYLVVILLVQLNRCVKRFYVRRFANNTSKNMRHIIYNSLVNMSHSDLQKENLGSVMTKAVSDVDSCVEGMRKFTTEVFDTGVVLVSYLVMLFYYDWRLALVSCAFTPIAYLIAEKLKTFVARYNSEYKKSAGRLNNTTMDRVSNALTYRVYGCDKNRNENYESYLSDYEKKSVKANILESTMQPLYNVISMCGVIFILYIGARNVMGNGWTAWNIASFTTFLSCFTKMAFKSSKAAKLFNAVQKAQVSWKRIKPFMKECTKPNTSTQIDFTKPVEVKVQNLSIKSDSKTILKNISFTANEGTIIGVTGSVGSGKSLLGKTFIGEVPYSGSILINGKEVNELTPFEKSSYVTYMGHEPELMSDSVEENIKLGGTKDISEYLKDVCLFEEVEEMPLKEKTFVGSGGVELSGGQQSRLSLARTLYNAKDILILDDPFSAVDKNTEEQIFSNLKKLSTNKIIILISHRLAMFPKMDNVLFLEKGTALFSTHENFIMQNKNYEKLYKTQCNALKNDLDIKPTEGAK